MPTYVYECAKCGDEFELWQSFAEDPLKKHPSCGGKVTKVLQPVGIVLKGSGFYKNDSRTGSRKGGSKKGDSTGDRPGTTDTPKSPAADSGASTKPDSAASNSGSNGSKGDKKASTAAAKPT